MIKWAHMLSTVVILVATGMPHAAMAQTPASGATGRASPSVAHNRSVEQRKKQSVDDTADRDTPISEDAQQAIFGLYGGEKWRSKRLTEFFGTKAGHIIPAFERHFKEHGEDKLLVLALIIIDEDETGFCRSCPIGGAIFVRRHAKWVVESQEKILGIGADYGGIGDVHLVRIGKGRFGLSIRERAGNQGYFTLWETIFVPHNGLLSKALEVSIPESPTQGACENPVLDPVVSIKLEPAADSDYFDALTVTAYNDGRCDNFVRRTEKARYRLHDGKYKLINRIRHARTFKLQQSKTPAVPE